MKNRPPAPVPRTGGLRALKPAADRCRACPIGERATQAVVGEGPLHALVMLVGEQPGSDEDLAGAPFVGPSGRLLNRALAAAGLPREEVFVTNAVKHFKWSERPTKPRLHMKPNGGEIQACRPWFERELELVRPRVIVCLGTTAASQVFGRVVRLKDYFGKAVEVGEHTVVVTNHPSAALRAITPADRHAVEQGIVAALRLAKRVAERSAERAA